MRLLIEPDATPAPLLVGVVSAGGYVALTALAGWGYLAAVDETVLAGLTPLPLRYFLVGMMAVCTAFVATGAAAVVGRAWRRVRGGDR